ncbi:MAG: FTR1 family protein [Actinomycetales bacterium]|nr:FTR1 family protein [Actinomycetales bacterium]
MFANFLIGLREGLEAALVVAILVAYLVRIDQRSLLPRLWAGVGLAIGLSVLAVIALEITGSELSDEAAEAFAGFMSLLAVALITWMIFWMARNARALKAHLHGEVDRAIAKSGWALALVAFLAVGREGLETALFLWTGMRSSGQDVEPIVGAALGLGTAVALGFLIYRGAIRLNLSRLFFWTGVGLVVIAAGVLRYGVHELQEVNILPGKDAYVLDLSGVLDPAGPVAGIIRAVFNVVPQMTALELIAWGGYLIVVMALFVRTVRVSGPRPAATRGLSAPSAPGATQAQAGGAADGLVPVSEGSAARQ